MKVSSAMAGVSHRLITNEELKYRVVGENTDHGADKSLHPFLL
jgi:hypothetical protein